MVITPQELSVAERVARNIGRKWSLVEIDDLTSHLYLWLCENPQTLERWRSEGVYEGKLYVALRREARKWSAREQAARVGRPLSDGNFYDSARVTRVLPFIFEDAPQRVVTVNPVTGQSADVGTDFDLAIVVVSDIRSAFYGLNKDIREVLEWRFREDMTFDEIGELRGITPRGAKGQVDRGVARLVDSLNGSF